MSALRVGRMYGRFIVGLPSFLRRRISMDEARAEIQRGLAEREDNFLRMLRRGIFGYRHSPYLPLLRLAGCERGDIEASVRAKGLEPTLLELREAGVYFTFEEYKGRQPVVRQGQVIPVAPQDFDNPFTTAAYRGETGGTTGAGARVTMDLEHLWSTIPHLMLMRAFHGVLESPMATWRGVLPDPTGLGILLRAVSYGGVPVRWFVPVGRDTLRPAFKNRMATKYILAMSRLCGVKTPEPEPVPIAHADVIARWAAETIARHGSCLIATSISLAARLCLAATDHGIDLTGLTLLGGGEPITPGKDLAVTRSGARFVPVYVSGDTGPVGLGCTHPIEENDLHLVDDRVALIQYARTIPQAGTTVDAFNYTSLRPSAGKILLNVESDDFGIVERRACGCPFEDLGYPTHLRRVRSFGKLTGEGVTLIGSDMTHILEQVLPARFGGGPLDYQIAEEEDDRGLTRLTLLVNPTIAIPRDDLVIQAVLDALGTKNDDRGVARAYWQQAGTFRVRREEPTWTARGKLRSIRVTKRTTASTDEPVGASTASGVDDRSR